MKRDEIRAIITNNKLEDAVTKFSKILTKEDVGAKENCKGWISVANHPPKIKRGNIMSEEYLCCDAYGNMLVASLFKIGNLYTGYPKDGRGMPDVRYYRELPQNPNLI